MARHWLLPGGEPCEISPPIVVTGERGPVALTGGPGVQVAQGLTGRFEELVVRSIPQIQQDQFAKSCGPKPYLPPGWQALPIMHPLRVAFRKWVKCMQES